MLRIKSAKSLPSWLKSKSPEGLKKYFDSNPNSVYNPNRDKNKSAQQLSLFNEPEKLDKKPAESKLHSKDYVSPSDQIKSRASDPKVQEYRNFANKNQGGTIPFAGGPQKLSYIKVQEAVAPILDKLSEKPIHFDTKKVQEAIDNTTARMEELQGQSPVDLNKDAEVVEYLKKQGHDLWVTKSGNASLNSAFLKTVDDPVAKLKVEYSSLKKARSTYNSLLKNDGYQQPEYHVQENLGRLAVSNFNVHSMTKEMKSFVVPPKGKKYIKVDASQLEPNVISQIVGDENLQKILQSSDPYTTLAKTALHKDEVIPDERKAYKTTFLAILNDQPAEGTARVLGISVEDARKIQNNLRNGLMKPIMDYKRNFLNTMKQKNRETVFDGAGQAKKIEGLNNNPEEDKSVFTKQRTAFSHILQSTSATQFLDYMSKTQDIAKKYGVDYAATVHDSVTFEVPENFPDEESFLKELQDLSVKMPFKFKVKPEEGF